MANVMFSEKEIEYLKSQHIARIATAAVSPDGPVRPMLYLWVSISTVNTFTWVE